MTRTTNEIMEDFIDLACALSPENLWCDGEASSEEVEKKLKSINKGWEQLETEIGHKVTEDDVWNWHMKEQEKFKAEQINNSTSSITKKKNFFGT